ncbi:unnamed protein product [Moneuplotes crassus]|uniref:Palmitoyltransferase n=1 Tax=Euplotes crassus TaxID=5936 RepID=A0AAD1XKM0_EUPCR|nr:unnamed protein product [Moneuplotes crassus]
MDISKNSSKVNGNACSWNKGKAITFSIMSLQIGVTLAIILPSVNKTSTLIIFSLLYAIFMILTLLFCWITSLINPGLLNNKYHSSNSVPGDIEEGHQALNCNYCQTQVTERFKHCRDCNKCIKDFDHHCWWLNTCIGSSNYKYFILYLVAYCIMNIAAIVPSFIVVCAKSKSNAEQFGSSHLAIRICAISACIISLILSLLTLSFCGGLLMFHLYLRIKGITTYEFIILRRRSRINKISKISAELKKEKAQIEARIKDALKQHKNSSREEFSSIEKFDIPGFNHTFNVNFNANSRISKNILTIESTPCANSCQVDFLNLSRREIQNNSSEE